MSSCGKLCVVSNIPYSTVCGMYVKAHNCLFNFCILDYSIGVFYTSNLMNKWANFDLWAITSKNLNYKLSVYDYE